MCWNRKVEKPCYENTIYSGRYTNSTKGSTYSNPLTGKRGKRTKQTNRPKTYYIIGEIFRQTVHQSDCDNIKKGSNGQTCIRLKENY